MNGSAHNPSTLAANGDVLRYVRGKKEVFLNDAELSELKAQAHITELRPYKSSFVTQAIATLKDEFIMVWH